ncbi:MAG: tRNA (adenosine(37)-N6)-threonylcarbamoyltransferase complex ATPase subunit type 1 TsaE [Flammeovirgaceae bacterium TMED290]|nr:MAG: tRNA (adenosine(37)-N6)-threonylcarbamoyltransferase complex ATPase subunit type 1 TsaE [Flammeovirgaceae bacterium TMED290]|tara:strand:- start:15858 stop:16277 length:420 start_codon:yes stop_codon:yes gene_type:complete
MKFKNISESDYIKLFDLIQKKDKSLKIFLFSGKVGSGKTTMIKSFTNKLSVNNNTSSPTFNIVNEYKDDDKKSIYHFDLYRLKSINDLVEIGFGEYINSGNYCFIEWPEIAYSFFVDKYISINISINSKNSRDIDITFH